MKKLLKSVLVTSIIMMSILATMVFFLSKQKNEKKKVSGLDLLIDAADEQVIQKGASEHLSIGKNERIIQFAHNRDVYNEANSTAIRKKIDRMKKENKYTVDHPLMIWNPFGTNKLSLYYYFRDNESTYLKYTIQVDNDHIPEYTRILNNHMEGNITRIHEYSLTGFVPGYQNYVTIRRYNKRGKLIKKQSFDLYVDKLSDNVKTKVTYEDGKSKESISEGLYCICGYHNEKGKTTNVIPFYDNSGILRCAIPIKNYRTDRIENVDGSFIYSFSKEAFAKVSDIGQVEKIYKLGNYTLYHDYIYNDYGQLWCLASKKGENSVGDYVISIDLESGKVEEMVDFGKMFGGIKQCDSKNFNKGKLNWIDINSICRVGSSDAIVSSRELSSIIKIEHITSENPGIAYIISDRSIWKKQNNKKYLLLKGAYLDKKWYNLSGDKNKLEEGIQDFSSQLGQNSVTCEEGNGLSEGQYYLTMLNNNYAYSTTLPNVNWAKFMGAGHKHQAANSSFYYEYLVDEKAGYYGLKRSYQLPYTAKGGNVFWNGTNTIANSMGEKVFGEYDRFGELIRKFTLKAYRVYKYDMKNIWYY